MNNFGYVSSGLCILVSKVLRVTGYFSKPKGVRDPKRLGNTILDNISIKLAIFSWTFSWLSLDTFYTMCWLHCALPRRSKACVQVICGVEEYE